MPSALDYQTIVNNAFQNLGTITANAQRKKQRITDLLNQYNTDNEKGRGKTHLGNREAASSRGMLQSGQSLKTIDETNTAYNAAFAKAQSGANDQMVGLDADVQSAQGQYDTAKVNWTAAQKLEEEQAAEAIREKRRQENDATAAAANAALQTPAPEQDFLTWHSQLSPEDKTSFNTAYNPPAVAPAYKPKVSAPKKPTPPKPKKPVVNKGKFR